MANTKNRLLNISLQSATLCARFLLIFFLAKYLNPASVGYYGLFTAAVGYSLYFVGLDFYTYATREILKTPQHQRGRLLKSHATLSGLLYVLFLPFAFVLLQFTDWPSYMLLWFFPILLLEHFNQEIYRLLIALSEQITASVILFVRQGSWALAIVALMAWNTSSRQLQTVMALWAVAGLAAAAMGIWKLSRLQMGGWGCAPDWRWIKKGIAVSTAFVLATLALRGVQTADRYWLQALGGIDVVGGYVLLFGVAGSLMAFLDAGIFSFAYPVLIKLHQTNETNLARLKVRQMLGHTIFLSTGFAVISWLLLPYLLLWINKPAYSNVIHFYPWLLSAMIMNALSMVPHFGLYARGCDKPIIRSHVGAMVIFVPTIWMLSGHFLTLAVLIGLNVSFALILLWKGIAYWQLNRAEDVAKSFSQPA